tara:strand:+ start:4430 stop:5101 length:672 start_codon:yes stop_codon:yes gene_type:complete
MPRPKLRHILFTCLLCLFAAIAHSSQASDSRVIDGDTLIINGNKIRLHGIDAPEANQMCVLEGKPWKCGEAATQALIDILQNGYPRCEHLNKDRYGRSISRCFNGAGDVSELLVRQGFALAYRKYSADYVSAEEFAKAGKSGIFAGQFVPPWDWRRGKRLKINSERVGNCLIKGNINRKGEKIYHLPGSTFYSRTRVTESDGEKWFCSTKDAEAAGWRQSRAK